MGSLIDNLRESEECDLSLVSRYELNSWKDVDSRINRPEPSCSKKWSLGIGYRPIVDWNTLAASSLSSCARSLWGSSRKTS